MYHRILIADDGSEVARTSVPYAGVLAKLFEAEVAVVHVSPVAGEVRGSESSAAWANAVDAGEENPALQGLGIPLADTLSQLKAHGATSVGAMVFRGDPRSVIPDVARQLNVDLIVMASNGRSGWKRAILGSVADHVTRNSDVPVLLCRPQPDGTDSPFKRLAVPIDESSFSAAALTHVAAIRAVAGSDTQVIRLIEHDGVILSTAVPVTAHEPLPEPRSADGSAMRTVDVEDIVVNGLRLERVEGGIATGIIETARSTNCGTIVMSTRGRGGIARTLLGSTGDEVARGIDQGAVLLVRPS